ncbi:MAG: SHOCT domain-containing protein [Acidobacteria bacterium]|jgi:3-keto-L-gulonate-6-phosphate decarboxylase|nr:SHOCT domain-containing protein [Acidobacteriota bacterium]
MFMRRRRPLMRAAVVGGVAYHAGRRNQEGRQEDEMTEARLQQLEAQQAAPAAPAGGMSAETMEQLKQLGQLKDQGILTDAEFDQQKQKLLQAS